MCVYCNRSKKRSCSFFTRCDVICDLLQYTHTEKCYLFILYNKNSKRAWKKKNKSSDLIWRGFDTICVCAFNRSQSTTNKNAHRSHTVWRNSGQCTAIFISRAPASSFTLSSWVVLTSTSTGKLPMGCCMYTVSRSVNSFGYKNIDMVCFCRSNGETMLQGAFVLWMLLCPDLNKVGVFPTPARGSRCHSIHGAWASVWFLWQVHPEADQVDTVGCKTPDLGISLRFSLSRHPSWWGKMSEDSHCQD